MSLTEIIIDTIRKNGPISFRDFMEMALYYPGLGYYTSAREKIGKSGDYYTSPTSTSILGKMIGIQLEEMWYLLGKQPFTIIEYGAGTGSLCFDILEHLKTKPQLYATLKYCIIERSAAMRKKEKRVLHEKVSWHNSIQEIDTVIGCVLSNELVDNFAVHQVAMTDDLMEVLVDYKDDFTEVLGPAPDILRMYLKKLKAVLPRGYRTEINLEALAWIREIANSLKEGFVITIDYGYSSAELYQDYRNRGTLVCYNKHSINTNPYNNIGEQDITAHVNFSALHQWGLKFGLDFCGFTNQTQFLLDLGLVDHLRMLEIDKRIGDINSAETTFMLSTFLLKMGHKLKVLIQKKGVKSSQLSGLKLAQCHL